MTKTEKLTELAHEIKNKAETLDALTGRRELAGISDADLKYLATRLRNDCARFINVVAMSFSE